MLDRIRSPVLDRIRLAAAQKYGTGTGPRTPDETAIEVAEKLLPKDGNKGNFLGSACSAVVDHTPHYLEVMGPNPAGLFSSFFHHFLLSFTSAVLYQVPQGHQRIPLCVVKAIKNGCLAVLPGTKQAQ